MKKVEKIVREEIVARANTAKGKFGAAVAPIYGVTDKNIPVHIGSAIFLNLNEGKFLFTAAHVIDWNRETTLYVGDNELLELSFDAWVSRHQSDDRAQDHFDFAVARLSENFCSHLSRIEFVDENEICQSDQHMEGHAYTCIGYPNSKNKVTGYSGKKVKSVLGTYTGVAKAAESLSFIEDSSAHLGLKYSPKYSKNDSGDRVNSISIRGFSGGAIIDIGEFTLQSRSDPPVPKLAAILAEFHDNEGVILGTRIRYVIEMLRAENRI